MVWCDLLYLPCLGSCPPQRCESTEEQDDGETEEQQEAAEPDEDRIWLKACTCFIRTRYISDAIVECGLFMKMLKV